MLEVILRYAFLFVGCLLILIGLPMRTSNDSGVLMGYLFIAIGGMLVLGAIALAFF